MECNDQKWWILRRDLLENSESNIVLNIGTVFQNTFSITDTFYFVRMYEIKQKI